MSNEMHSKVCLAEALISAVQNLRDNEGISSFDFRIAVQNNELLAEADEYLGTGLQTCTCGAKAMDEVRAAYNTYGATHATALAAEFLKDNKMTVGQYIRLVRWSEGRA